MVLRPVLALVALGCLAAALVWVRSAVRYQRSLDRLLREPRTWGDDEPVAELALTSLRKDLHTALLYGLLAVALGSTVLSPSRARPAWVLLVVPVLITLRYSTKFARQARLAEQRAVLERRAEEVLSQEELAPHRWAARLAPKELPAIEGFEVGQVYEAGTGAMAGDFYDLYPTSKTRLVAVIGDVAGHGIEPSITAFQVKYLLRNFLRQYRDPAQAVEELNKVLSAQGRPEDLVSLCAVVFDMASATLRYASAGHPAAYLWHDGEVSPLRSTGPLLTLDPAGEYASVELPLAPGDVLLLYTDGLTEARAGEQLYGEERVAALLRRDPGQDAAVLCKSLLESARDFATTPMNDDVAILAIRRT